MAMVSPLPALAVSPISRCTLLAAEEAEEARPRAPATQTNVKNGTYHQKTCNPGINFRNP